MAAERPHEYPLMRPDQHHELAEVELRGILDTIVDGIVTIDATGTIHSFNRAAERIFGYPAEEAIGKNVAMLMPEPFASEHDGYVRRYIETGIARIIGIGREVTGLRKDGSMFSMDLAVSDSVMGDVRIFTGIVRDISERRRAADELRQTEERLRLLADVGRAVGNADDLEGVVSAAAAVIAGEFADACAIDVVEGESSRRAALATASPGEGSRWEKELGEPSQLIALASDATSQVIAMEGEPGVDCRRVLVALRYRDKLAGAMCLLRSAERRSFCERDLETVADAGRRISARLSAVRMTADLRTANAIKDEVLGLVSHELRTPLTTLKGNASVLRRHFEKLDAEAREMVFQDLERDAERLQSIIENMLLIARGEGDYDAEPILLRRVVEKVVDEMARQAGAGAIRVEPGQDALAVLGHAVYLRQIVANLLTNALKYSPPGAPIEVVMQREGDRAVLSVLDRGYGIAPESMPHVFEPFFRSEKYASRVSGVGLGLAVCKRLVEAQGGTISVANRPDGGSVFTCSFPLLAEAEDSNTAARAEAALEPR